MIKTSIFLCTLVICGRGFIYDRSHKMEANVQLFYGGTVLKNLAKFLGKLTPKGRNSTRK